MDTITITHNNRPATTAAIAAARYGMQTQALRHSLNRAGIQPVGHIDQRTPLYLVADVDRHLAGRRCPSCRVSSSTSEQPDSTSAPTGPAPGGGHPFG